jgi:hypothetical protein
VPSRWQNTTCSFRPDLTVHRIDVQFSRSHFSWGKLFTVTEHKDAFISHFYTYANLLHKAIYQHKGIVQGESINDLQII